MSVMIIGGDRLGNIVKNLQIYGYDVVKHVSGRKKREVNCNIPCNIDMVMVFTDYVNHEVVNTIKREGKKRNFKMIFVKRSWSHIADEIKI
ncbi:DUF2325 domain-containing protein [Aceticella autotrophica]|uniref:DUF2325 domain-containing protein n=1 Tax=Aceticella autotrophica TaxID=2755338 RepID=A0A975G9X4_9THEO|nr:DUF2325 domain-containing protein [Aceticella autotrophica]QSZ26979.1 DUF2325 domain-containing protein [Aceticella autotrophica]